MKVLLIAVASVAGIAVICEVGLRAIAGLGKPILYMADPEIGYLVAPNQKLRRQGIRYETNQYSMRSQPLNDNSQQRILLLGDSVVNGSWWTEQDKTLSGLLSDRLSAETKVEVLNISANSWSPRNELAYLERFGLFEAKTLVLVINTDDLLAVKPTSSVVGKSYSYPDTKPPLALVDYYQTFIAAPRRIPELERFKQETSESDRIIQNIKAIRAISAIADANNTEFILVLTPLLREFKSGSTDIEQEARQQLQKLVNSEGINYIDILSTWADFPQPEFLYRDRIHPSPHGNNKIVEAIADRLATRDKGATVIPNKREKGD